ncbi:phosphoribosylaminoimidazolecarboxamide formyltransferase/IMP cyclohydrolase [Brevibacterium mcbrellneri ATCC 49030]|uniref:Bifunctional purine biosynthesis protein PurH n=1 Tax=Brevibacterium mcbrellneri ATCC 49030 TaxID=585530 RepID=D4YQY6_9MICO|nr:bifunctional phosphoribosylaminoimidazolecarboxamide formyltransferase/IMP cyclohydrolase [Brevibacterium mcbrellneri]EFG46377.1 phosphoribosylaminoimidazolecarboxamide formyltransferase/IMP cyclohydrolase [Brevibacterium mcbrellneri ATCC 49030]
MSEQRPIRRALISVFDKTGLEEFAQSLASAGVDIVSTGSTASTIAQAGVTVTKVEELTNFPECLDGRVKTLHPRVHAGILADTRNPDHMTQLADLNIEAFDLVVVNLYPFSETVASGAGYDDCIEKIDIGGPSMVRAAAKNHASVAIVVDPVDYSSVVEAVQGGGFTLEDRTAFAAKAFAHTAAYDVAVASWFASHSETPEFFGATGQLKSSLRYGENPHQEARVYATGGGLASAKQLHGKEMSYNNYQDTDAAVRTAYDFDEPAVAIIKHANPCGVAVGSTIEEAHTRAHECDSVSAFGGVIATNRPVTVALAEQIAPIFTEVVAAPSFEEGAAEVLQKKKNIRLLELGDVSFAPTEFRSISGGILVQERDVYQAPGDKPDNWTLATGEPADDATLADLVFAWRAVRSVKSNAILLAKDGASVGIGMGQVNRVDSARLAVSRAGEERARGSVVASDAFFPFADGLEVLIEAGVRAVVQPGGSIRDEEVIEAARKAGLTLYLTGTRHFFH